MQGEGIDITRVHPVLRGRARRVQSATINAADLIGRPELFGSISAGKSADIIAVKGNPLADARVLEQVDFVMKEGLVYKHERRDVARPPAVVHGTA
jgi:cytosine/adenosine deaminase-related metal-dependent hydrolase